MNFCKSKQIFNRKLIEIWSYRKYTSEEEKKADEISRNIFLYKKLKVKQLLERRNILHGDAYMPGNI